jgi:hypothetical protein
MEQTAMGAPDPLIEGIDQVPPPFGEAEQLLMSEARARVEFEQKTAAVLHTKSALFLAMAGVLAAVMTTLVGRLLDRADRSLLESAGLIAFALCLGVLTLAAVVLVRSAFSRAYQMPALPARWADHLAGLKARYAGSSTPDVHALAHLRYDLLDGWHETAEESAKRNDEKARTLERVVAMLTAAAAGGVIGLVLVLLSALRPG